MFFLPFAAQGGVENQLFFFDNLMEVILSDDFYFPDTAILDGANVLISSIPGAIPEFDVPAHLRPPAPESPKSPSARVPMSLRIRRL